MGGIGGFFKTLKKKITLKGAIRAVATVGSVIPVVGGALQAVAGVAAGATQQAQQAQAQAEQQVQQAFGTGTYQVPVNPPGSQPLIQQQGIVIDGKTAMIAGGALLALFLLARRR